MSYLLRTKTETVYLVNYQPHTPHHRVAIERVTYRYPPVFSYPEFTILFRATQLTEPPEKPPGTAFRVPMGVARAIARIVDVARKTSHSQFIAQL